MLFFDSWHLSILNSIVYGIGALPEAKIGPVKEGQKEGWILEGYTHFKLANRAYSHSGIAKNRGSNVPQCGDLLYAFGHKSCIP